MNAARNSVVSDGWEMALNTSNDKMITGLISLSSDNDDGANDGNLVSEISAEESSIVGNVESALTRFRSKFEDGCVKVREVVPRIFPRWARDTIEATESERESELQALVMEFAAALAGLGRALRRTPGDRYCSAPKLVGSESKSTTLANSILQTTVSEKQLVKGTDVSSDGYAYPLSQARELFASYEAYRSRHPAALPSQFFNVRRCPIDFPTQCPVNDAHCHFLQCMTVRKMRHADERLLFSADAFDATMNHGIDARFFHGTFLDNHGRWNCTLMFFDDDLASGCHTVSDTGGTKRNAIERTLMKAVGLAMPEAVSAKKLLGSFKDQMERAAVSAGGSTFNQGVTVFREDDQYLASKSITPFQYNDASFLSLEHAYVVLMAVNARMHDVVSRLISVNSSEELEEALEDSAVISLLRREKSWFPNPAFTIMAELSRAKFRQCVPARNALLSSAQTRIHLLGSSDTFWACGFEEQDAVELLCGRTSASSRFSDCLGTILTAIRNELQVEAKNSVAKAAISGFTSARRLSKDEAVPKVSIIGYKDQRELEVPGTSKHTASSAIQVARQEEKHIVGKSSEGSNFAVKRLQSTATSPVTGKQLTKTAIPRPQDPSSDSDASELEVISLVSNSKGTNKESLTTSDALIRARECRRSPLVSSDMSQNTSRRHVPAVVHPHISSEDGLSHNAQTSAKRKTNAKFTERDSWRAPSMQSSVADSSSWMAKLSPQSSSLLPTSTPGGQTKAGIVDSYSIGNINSTMDWTDWSESSPTATPTSVNVGTKMLRHQQRSGTSLLDAPSRLSERTNSSRTEERRQSVSGDLTVAGGRVGRSGSGLGPHLLSNPTIMPFSYSGGGGQEALDYHIESIAALPGFLVAPGCYTLLEAKTKLVGYCLAISGGIDGKAGGPAEISKHLDIDQFPIDYPRGPMNNCHRRFLQLMTIRKWFLILENEASSLFDTADVFGNLLHHGTDERLFVEVFALTNPVEYECVLLMYDDGFEGGKSIRHRGSSMDDAGQRVLLDAVGMSLTPFVSTPKESLGPGRSMDQTLERYRVPADSQMFIIERAYDGYNMLHLSARVSFTIGHKTFWCAEQAFRFYMAVFLAEYRVAIDIFNIPRNDMTSLELQRCRLMQVFCDGLDDWYPEPACNVLVQVIRAKYRASVQALLALLKTSGRRLHDFSADPFMGCGFDLSRVADVAELSWKGPRPGFTDAHGVILGFVRAEMAELLTTPSALALLDIEDNKRKALVSALASSPAGAGLVMVMAMLETLIAAEAAVPVSSRRASGVREW